MQTWQAVHRSVSRWFETEPGGLTGFLLLFLLPDRARMGTSVVAVSVFLKKALRDGECGALASGEAILGRLQPIERRLQAEVQLKQATQRL